MKTDNGNVSNEDGMSGRNDVAKAVKRICEKRDQGFAVSHRLGERKRNVMLLQKRGN